MMVSCACSQEQQSAETVTCSEHKNSPTATGAHLPPCLSSRPPIQNAACTKYQQLNVVELACFTPELSASWLAPLQRLEGLTRVLETITFTPSTDINSNLLLHFFFYPLVFCAAVMQSLPLTFLPFVLSCISACLSLLLEEFSFLWILIPPQCLRSPPAFSKTLFSPFLSVSLPPFVRLADALLLSLDVSFGFLIRLTQSSAGFDLTIPLSLSLSLSPSHTLRLSLSSWVACRSELACLSVSCRVTELLDSFQLSGWPISAQIHTF